MGYFDVTPRRRLEVLDPVYDCLIASLLMGLETSMDSGEVSRGEKMTLRGTDSESYITEYT